MYGQDVHHLLCDQVKQAVQQRQPLRIVGHNSKAWLGRECRGTPLSVREHYGIVEYDPRELVITARAGTLLSTIQAALNDSNQMLAFEPPQFGNATLGGTIACGLSGSRRPFVGSARDFVLGCQLINGRGEMLRFGGQVMKNVAGYDVSRLQCSAYGTLGVMLELSLKVLPKPAASITLLHECSEQEAIEIMSGLLRQPLPVDGACYYRDQLYLRLSGSEQAIHQAEHKLPGERINHRSHFWQRLREQQLAFFDRDTPLWRIVVKPATPPLPLSGDWLLDWGGAQRWLVSDLPAVEVFTAAAKAGGHAMLFRSGGNAETVFQPLHPAMLALQQRIKQSFDPHCIFNRGRMYAEI